MDVLCLLTVLLFGPCTFGFSIVEEGVGQEVLEGQSFTVLCQVDSFYEFCVFVSPTGQRCEYEWKRKPWNISRSGCPELELRTSFAGDYNQYQCGLRVDAARTRDSGLWSCEMESYKFGGGRGSGYVVQGGVQVLVSKPTTTTTTTERPTRASIWDTPDIQPTNREGRRLWDLDVNLRTAMPAIPSKSDLAMAALGLSGLLPILVVGIVIVVFISMFSFLVITHKRKAAMAKVTSLQKIEEGRKEKDAETKVEKSETMAEQVHNQEVLFMRKVFPHIISLSEEDLGLNL